MYEVIVLSSEGSGNPLLVDSFFAWLLEILAIGVG